MGHGSVVPITTATDIAGKPIEVEGEPQAIAITPGGKAVYVPNQQSGVPSSQFGAVVVISTLTNTPEKSIPVGAGPIAVAMTPDGKTAYVVSLEAGTVTPTPPRPAHRGSPSRSGYTPTPS